MVRIGSALFNANHGRLEDELYRVQDAGVDFLHWDVFDGTLVPDLGFSPRTMHTLRERTDLPFEVHLVAADPPKHIGALAKAGANLIFLPAEASPLLYEAIYAVREAGLKAGLCLALGTPLAVLDPVITLLDAVLLLGRVTGEGRRGREFNPLVLDRTRAVARLIAERAPQVDLQVAGGLELDSTAAVVAAGARSLPLGGLLHRERDLAAFVRDLRARVTPTQQASAVDTGPQRFRVLVASRSFGRNCPEAVAEMEQAGCELVYAFRSSPSEEQLLAHIGDADALISGTEPVTERVLAAAPNLKVISKHGVGIDNIDLEAARRRGIPVAVARSAINDSVADLTLALILSLARQVVASAASARAGRWDRFVGVELRDRVLGVVGAGAIGQAVCRRAQAFGLRCLAHDAYQDQRFSRRYGVPYVSFDQLLDESDFVSIHVPLLPETRRMFGVEQFRRMKRTAYLINTARGELVDEEALCAALAGGEIAGAASDVFRQEPPTGSPLLTLENFLPTTHIAGQTDGGLARMGQVCAENVLRVLRGHDPLYRVV